MTLKTFYALDNSIQSFEHIKKSSERYWATMKMDYDPGLAGWQIQTGSKWKQGLSEREIKEFEKELGMEFPESLKNYYRTMNGLDRPMIDVHEEEEPRCAFYSYPDDIQAIKDTIQWIFEKNRVTPEKIRTQNIPMIFPYYCHRCLIIEPNELVLSMWGKDIIFFADKLSRGIAMDIFGIGHRKDKLNIIRSDHFWDGRVWWPGTNGPERKLTLD